MESVQQRRWWSVISIIGESEYYLAIKPLAQLVKILKASTKKKLDG